MAGGWARQIRDFAFHPERREFTLQQARRPDSGERPCNFAIRPHHPSSFVIAGRAEWLGLTPELVGQVDRCALLAPVLGGAALADHVSDDYWERVDHRVEPGRPPAEEVVDVALGQLRFALAMISNFSSLRRALPRMFDFHIPALVIAR